VSKILKSNYQKLNQWNKSFTTFARPANGFSSMYGFILNELKEIGNINVYLDTNIKRILIDKKTVVTDDGKELKYDHLLSSIPLALLCRLSDVPLDLKLEYKPLYSIFYTSESAIIPNCNVLFNFTERGYWKRVTFHSCYYGTNNGKHYFVLESMPDKIHLESDDGINLLDRDFKATFVNTQWFNEIKNAEIVGYRLLPNAYPIYTTDFDPHELKKIKDYFASKSIYLIGRQGEFDYISSSDAAKSAVSRIDEIS
jgi:protoporphyrinogen oxidase